MLEARDRVGGRTLNEPIGDGKVVEIGAQWVGPTQDRVLRADRRAGLETFPTYSGRRQRLRARRRAGPLLGHDPPREPGRARGGGSGDVAAQPDGVSGSLDAPWTAPKAERWDSETFATWMRRNVRTEVARDILRLAIIGVWACEPRDLSLLHVLFYIRSAGSLERLTDTEGGAQQDRVVGGTS